MHAGRLGQGGRRGCRGLLTCPHLVADRVASRLFQRDHTLWGGR